VITDRRLPAGRPDGQLQSCSFFCFFFFDADELAQ